MAKSKLFLPLHCNPCAHAHLVIHNVTDPAGRAESGHHEHAFHQSLRAEAGVGAVGLPGDERHDGERNVLDEHLCSVDAIVVSPKCRLLVSHSLDKLWGI